MIKEAHFGSQVIVEKGVP